MQGFSARHPLEPSARRVLLATTASCVLALGTHGAQAQTSATATASENNSTTVEALVVTAQKRSEQLKNVPQSISVLTQTYLNQISADSLETFANTIPGLQVQQRAPGQTRITIRGISPDEQTGVTAVSYYLDEIPIAQADQRSQPEIWLYDIDRVEVLRGPQGTLWGEGAMGGTIHIVTTRPNTHDFEASGRGDVYTIENGGTGYKLDEMLNLPLIKDTLALRLVVGHRYNAGWIDQTIVSIPNPTTPPPARYVTSYIDKDANHSENDSLRAILRFTPTNRLTIDGEYVINDVGVHNASYGEIDAFHNKDVGLRPNKDDIQLGNITATYNFDHFTITSASSYEFHKLWFMVNQEPFLLGPFFAPLVNNFTTANGSREETFTQELRATSDTTGRFRWTAGFFFQNFRQTGDTVLTVAGPTVPPTVLVQEDGASTYQTYAFFGQAEYDLIPKLTLVLGGRYFHEKAGLNATMPVVVSLQHSDNGFVPLVTLKSRLNNELMVYATFSEGYRAGGFNEFVPSNPSYNPDRTKNYEIGAKYVSPDNKLSLVGDFFYIDWSNMQYTQLAANGFNTFVANADKASSRGIEFTGDYHFTNGLWGRLNASWIDAHLDAPVPLTLGEIGGVANTGTPLPAVPTYQVSLSGGYHRPLTMDWDLDLSGVVAFVGPQHTKLEEGGTYVDSVFGGHYVIGSALSAYSFGNIRAEFSNRNFAVALYLDNLWNTTKPISNDNFLPLFGQPVYYLQPRTFGVQVSAKF
ncbi:MAG TPA: TonB-dependent receptor [Caulobacteraceae bacterium]|nr:TonB-dependent receptor [Caulobacteraceae bacterium]